MTSPEIACDDEQLRDMLQRPSCESPSEALLEHVEHCERCQAKIEQLAANAEEWRIAGEVLATSAQAAGDGRERDRDEQGRFVRGAHWAERPVAWTASMAKQLLSPSSHPEMLGRLGRYEVERLIGAGGMGVVFKAIDSELNRTVAIKVLAPYLAGSGPARQRFAREARAAAAVVHDHVVPIHNVETEQASPYLVMQYVAGESLQARLDREGPLELCEILRIGRQVAAGLSAAHDQGLVHRDIKPLNILLEPSIARALITDFGLARAADDASITNTGFHPGTPQYMSPEQVAGETVDARSDLFSLGSVLYAMCTGRSPFRAETSLAVMRRIADSQPRRIREINPAIPEWLERIVMKLLEKKPDQRFASASEVETLLEKCLAHVQQPTVNSLPAGISDAKSTHGVAHSQTTRRPSRSRVWWLAIGLITILIGVAVMLDMSGRAKWFGPAAAAPDVDIQRLIDTVSATSADPPTNAKNVPSHVVPIGTSARLAKTIHAGGLVSRIACSADGKRLAVVARQGSRSTLQVVDVDSGKPAFVVSMAKLGMLQPVPVAPPEGKHMMLQDGVTALEFSPDGKRLALGTLLGEAHIFDAQTGAVWRTLTGSYNESHSASEQTPLALKNRQRAMGVVRALAFSPDGNSLAVGGASFQDAVGLWSEGESKPRKDEPGRLKIWKFDEDTVRHYLGPSVVTDLAFSSDGQFLASAGRWDDERERGGGVMLWKPEDARPFHKLSHDSRDDCVGVRFLPNQNRLISVAFRDQQKQDALQSIIRLTDITTGIVEWERTIPRTGSQFSGFVVDRGIGLQNSNWTFCLLNAATGAETVAFRPPSAPEPAGSIETNWWLLPQRHWLALAPPCNDPDDGRIELWSFADAPNANKLAEKTDEPNVEQALPSVENLDTLGASVPGAVMEAANRRIRNARQSIDRVTPEHFEASIGRIVRDSSDWPAYYRAMLMQDLVLEANQPLQSGYAREQGNAVLYERVIHQCAMAGLEQVDEVPAAFALRLLEFATWSQLSMNTDDDPDWPAQRRLKATLWLSLVERVGRAIDPKWDESDRPQINNEVFFSDDPQLAAEHARRIEVERVKARRYNEQFLARRLLAERSPRMEEDLIRLYVRRPLQLAELEKLLEQQSTDATQRERIAKTVRLFHAIIPGGTRLKYGWPDGLAEAGAAGVPPLIEAVRDKTLPTFVRHDGAWALGLIGDPRALPVLQEVAADEATPAKYKDIAREFVRAMEEKNGKPEPAANPK